MKFNGLHPNFWIALATSCGGERWRAVTGASQAQERPSRPLTMVVPTAAGGGMDLVARIFAGRLSEILGQPVIVENVGNGLAATSRVGKAAPDGYHMSRGVGQMAFHPTVYKTPVYNVRTDFAPVALLAEQPFLLIPTRIRHASR
jgi:tripartite-type tricarboxylate transporter receptor subunit TctC